MKHSSVTMATAPSSPQAASCRALLCQVSDIDRGAGFGDLTIRCLVRCDGHVEVLDLMFAAIDIQILESAIADTRLAACGAGKSSVCDSTVCSGERCHCSYRAGTRRSEET